MSSKLTLSCFEVGSGSANLIIFPPAQTGEIRVGIFDCYTGPRECRAPLLRALKDLRQKHGDALRIVFLAISHYHYDHFLGIGEILDAFGEAVELFADPGIDIEKIVVAEYGDAHETSKRARRDLFAIERFVSAHRERLQPVVGPGVVLFEDRDLDILVRSVAPAGEMLRRVQRILSKHLRSLRERGSAALSVQDLRPPPSRFYDLNISSSALEIRFRESTIVLGGDVLSGTWRLLLKRAPLRPDSFVLSHHGSHTGFSGRDWSARVHRKGQSAIAAGKGAHQPSESVLRHLGEARTRTWATNVPEGWNSSSVLDFVQEVHYGIRPAGQPVKSDVHVILDGVNARVTGLELELW